MKNRLQGAEYRDLESTATFQPATSHAIMVRNPVLGCTQVNGQDREESCLLLDNASRTPLQDDGSILLDPSATYLVTGGLGGLGKAISVWLVEKGARNLLSLSPSAGSKPAHHQLFTELEGMSCNLIAIQGAVQSETDVRNAIAAARSPIKCLFHLAMQLRDASISDMTYDDWKAVTSQGCWYLEPSHMAWGVSGLLYHDQFTGYRVRSARAG